MLKGTPTSDRIGSYGVVRPFHATLEMSPITIPATAVDEAASLAATAPSWSSLVDRLNAPTPWRRDTCLVAWVGLILGLGGMVAKLSSSPSAAAPVETQALAVSPEEPATTTPEASSVLDASSTQQMMRRGLGYLTVHSSAARANVYINLKSYGGLEEKLIVPCGKRFVSIGIPARRPSRTVWLAPGKTMLIPCAGTYEATMNPRALR